MYDKILALIKEHGPMLPVEIAGKTQMNSFLAKAYMEELVSQERLKQGDKIGSTPIFFVSGQEEQAKKRVDKLNDTSRTVAAHVGKELDMSPEAQAKRERFKKHFDKTINEPDKPREKSEQVLVNKTESWERKPEQFIRIAEQPKISNQEIQQNSIQKKSAEIKERLTKLFAPKTGNFTSRPESIVAKRENIAAKRENIVAKTEKKEAKSKLIPKQKSASRAHVSQGGVYISQVRKMFESGQSKFIEEVSEKKKKAKYIVDFPSSIGAVRYYVVVCDKRSISKSDIALAYTEGSNLKLPTLLVANGKLASNAEDYADELGSLFKFKVVK